MKIVNIRKSPWRNVDIMIIGVTEVLDGLAKVVSLGFVGGTHLTMDYLCWLSRQTILAGAEEEVTWEALEERELTSRKNA